MEWSARRSSFILVIRSTRINIIDDPFLLALSDGGFQVGELAKHYIPGGHEITVTIHAEAERETLELLQQENVVIYEAALFAMLGSISLLNREFSRTSALCGH